VGGCLPIVELDGEKFYVDRFLRELRNVKDPNDRRPLSCLLGYRIGQRFKTKWT